jgi:hypothetical protein
VRFAVRRAWLLVLTMACGSRAELDVIAPHDASPDGAPVDAGHDAPIVDAHADVVDAHVDAEAGPDAEAPSLTLAVVGIGADRVSPADQGMTPDGKPDGHFTATAVGAFDALILVTTSNGQPAYGQEWDTLVNQDPIPPLGFSFTTGAMTWVLGVFENGQRVNDTQCRVSLAPGTHVLDLAASNSGFFNPGTEYKLYGRIGTTWLSSNVAVWK